MRKERKWEEEERKVEREKGSGERKRGRNGHHTRLSILATSLHDPAMFVLLLQRDL